MVDRVLLNREKDIKHYTSVDSLGLLDFDQVNDQLVENGVDATGSLVGKSSFGMLDASLQRVPRSKLSGSRLNPDFSQQCPSSEYPDIPPLSSLSLSSTNQNINNNNNNNTTTQNRNNVAGFDGDKTFSSQSVKFSNIKSDPQKLNTPPNGFIESSSSSSSHAIIAMELPDNGGGGGGGGGPQDVFSKLLSHFPEPPLNPPTTNEADDLMLVTPDGLIDHEESSTMSVLVNDVRRVSAELAASDRRKLNPYLRHSRQLSSPRRHTMTSSNASDSMTDEGGQLSSVNDDTSLPPQRHHRRRSSSSRRRRRESLVDRARSILETPRAIRPDPLLDQSRRRSISDKDILFSETPPDSPFFQRSSAHEFVNSQIGSILDQFDQLEKKQQRVSDDCQTWNKRRIRSLIHSHVPDSNRSSIISGDSINFSPEQRFATVGSNSRSSLTRKSLTEPQYRRTIDFSKISYSSLNGESQLENVLPPNNALFTANGRTRPSVENIFRASNRAKTLKIGMKSPVPNDIVPKIEDDVTVHTSSKQHSDNDDNDEDNDDINDTDVEPKTTTMAALSTVLEEVKKSRELPSRLYFFRIDIFALLTGRHRLSKDNIRIKSILFTKDQPQPKITIIPFEDPKLQHALKSFPSILRQLSKAYYGTSSSSSSYSKKRENYSAFSPSTTHSIKKCIQTCHSYSTFTIIHDLLLSIRSRLFHP